MSQHFPHLSLLECLRPAAGWRTDAAVISTYSAHLPVLVAALMALGGEVDDAGSGSRVGLVRALTSLRDKVHFVMQAGRLTQGKSTASIAALLDQFVLQIPWNEGPDGRGKSWHAKFVLVRQVPIAKGVAGERWVFMLGSRNLTRDTSWDIGFTLKSSGDEFAGKGMKLQTVDGLVDLAHDLAGLFPDNLKHWSSFGKTLMGRRWEVPEGLTVSELRLMLPEHVGRTMPSPPPDLFRVVAVSPFLDKGALAELAHWPLQEKTSQRQLLSTRPALAGVCAGGGKLDNFTDLLALAEPEMDAVAEVGDSSDEAMELDSVGLHAKMIYAEHASGSTLWLGSPNLTQRAWTRNAECVVRIDAIDKKARSALQDGMEALLERANTIDRQTLQKESGEETVEQRLAEARNQVAARLCAAKQRRGSDGSVFIECNGGPHPDASDIALLCGQMMTPFTLWPRCASKHQFLVPPELLFESECVGFKLSLGDQKVEWLQLIPFDPAFDVQERNACVLNNYLGSKQMLSWIHDVLSGYAGSDDGGAWDAPRQRGPRHTKTMETELPSLEQALRMWLTKDRHRMDEVDSILELRRRNRSEHPEDPVVEERLNRFSASWRVIRDVLPRGTL